MKKMLMVLVLSSGFASAALADTCGVVKAYSKRVAVEGRIVKNRIQYTNGFIINNAVLQPEDMSIITASMANSLIVCFSGNSSTPEGYLTSVRKPGEY